MSKRVPDQFFGGNPKSFRNTSKGIAAETVKAISEFTVGLPDPKVRYPNILEEWFSNLVSAARSVRKK